MGVMKFGYAFWYSEPHNETGKVQISDAGPYVDEGKFIRFFSVRSNAGPVLS